MSGRFLQHLGVARSLNPSSVESSRGRRWAIERLEARDLMHGGDFDSVLDDYGPEPNALPAYVSTMAALAREQEANAGSLSSLGISSVLSKDSISPKLSKPVIDQQTLDLQMGLPLLDSKPGAAKTLYLDFNGDFQRDWWHIDNGREFHFSNVLTPVFDTDGNSNSFGVGEQTLIKEIWARVAEDYAPFNINVSTNYYGAYENGKALQVVIGGSNANWLKQNSSGIASIGSYTDSAPNSVFVFDLAAWARAGVTDGDGRVLNAAAAIATTASHEAGHAFGLRHQAIYNSYGTKISNYNPGTADWTPIMGNNLCSDRTTWTYGPTDLGAGNLQSELDVLRDKLGYVTDDHGNLTSYASPLQTNPKGSFAGNGVIHYLGDVDSFKFTVSAGYVQINVSGAQYGPNLIPMVELWSSGGLIARAGGGSATQSVVGFDVKGGTYYVMVRPDGGYGSLGQYSVLVSVAPLRTTSIVSGLNTTSSMDSLLLVNSTSGLNDTQLLQTTALSTATKSSSTGAGQGADSLDVQATRSVVPAMASNTKSESRRPKFELHDEVFGLDEFDKEVAAWLS